MELKSPLFKHGEIIPEYYTCLGPNISPPLQIEDIPLNAKSLVLVFEDVDATPKPWTHWILFNIPVTTGIIKEGSIPKGAVERPCQQSQFWLRRTLPEIF